VGGWLGGFLNNINEIHIEPFSPPYSVCRVSTDARILEFAFGEPPFATGSELMKLGGTHTSAETFMSSKLWTAGDFWADVSKGGASKELQKRVEDDSSAGGYNLWFSCTVDGELYTSKTSPHTATGSTPLRFAPNCGQCIGCNPKQKKACINQQAGDKVKLLTRMNNGNACITSLSPLCPKAGANCTALGSLHFKFNVGTGEIRYNPPGYVFWRGSEHVYNAETE